MKFVAPLSLLGLASATPVAQQEAKSASQSATVLTDPVWVWDEAYISDDYYGTNWHMSVSLEEVPNSGENIHTICDGLSSMSEGYCPMNEAWAKAVYAELVVRHFMPNSLAAGVLDESEVSNIPASLGTGYRTITWDSAITVPDPIDNIDAVANRGSNGPNDVYGCGPVEGDEAWLQTVQNPTIGFLDDTAAAPNHCTALGMHNGYGDTFDNFKLKNVPCDETRYVICADFWEPTDPTHGGYAVTSHKMNSTNVDILKAAFDIMYDPANQVVEETVVENNSGNSTTTTEETTEAGNNKMIMIGGIVVVLGIVAFLVMGKK